MNLSDKILAQLKEEYRSGMTQQEIAKAHNVTHPQIQRLLSGQRDCGGLTIDTVSKMFPNATIHLHGDPVVASNSGINHGNVIGVNNGQIHSSSVENFRDRAIRAVLDLDLPPEHSMTVLKTLKNLEAKA